MKKNIKILILLLLLILFIFIINLCKNIYIINNLKEKSKNSFESQNYFITQTTIIANPKREIVSNLKMENNICTITTYEDNSTTYTCTKDFNDNSDNAKNFNDSLYSSIIDTVFSLALNTDFNYINLLFTIIHKNNTNYIIKSANSKYYYDINTGLTTKIISDKITTSYIINF